MFDDRKKEIRFRGYIKGRMFFLTVDNTYDGTTLYTQNGKLRTTKADEEAHGLGMNNINSCVEKYYGTMQYGTEREWFTLTIMLQGVADL